MSPPRTLTADLLHDGQATLAEGPRWDSRTDRLIWVDILAGETHFLDPATGTDDVLTLGRHVGAVLPRASGGYVACVREGFCTMTSDGHEEPLYVLFDDELRRMNDGRCDRFGRLWASSMTYDLSPGRAGLYRLGLDGAVVEALSGIWLGNGIDWSPDDTTMYFVDTLSHGIDQLDYDLETGAVRRNSRLTELPAEAGNPDGLTVDAEGGVWVAVYGGGRVERYTPAGKLDTIVLVPGVTQVTSPGFGGPNLDTLYITTARENFSPDDARTQPHAGGIFAVTPGVVGQPTSMFGA
jgi:sugar lactone lactonase YvrE